MLADEPPADRTSIQSLQNDESNDQVLIQFDSDDEEGVEFMFNVRNKNLDPYLYSEVPELNNWDPDFAAQYLPYSMQNLRKCEPLHRTVESSYESKIVIGVTMYNEDWQKIEQTLNHIAKNIDNLIGKAYATPDSISVVFVQDGLSVIREGFRKDAEKDF
jgi:hypothetical protein